MRIRRHYPVEPEACLAEQFRILRLRPFLPSQTGQHDEVQQLAWVKVVPWGDDRLHQEEPPGFSHRPAAVPKDGQGAVMVPVVDYPPEDVRVTSGRNRLKEISLYDFAPIGESGIADCLAGTLCHLRQFMDHAGHSGPLLQDCGDQRAVSAADVCDTGDAAEIVRLYDGGRDHLTEVVHGAIEDLSFFGVRCEVVEELGSCGQLEGRFAGPDTMKRLGI